MSLVIYGNAMVRKMFTRNCFLENLNHSRPFRLLDSFRENFTSDHLVQVEIVLIPHPHEVPGPRPHETTLPCFSDHSLLDRAEGPVRFGAVGNRAG